MGPSSRCYPVTRVPWPGSMNTYVLVGAFDGFNGYHSLVFHLMRLRAKRVGRIMRPPLLHLRPAQDPQSLHRAVSSSNGPRLLQAPRSGHPSHVEAPGRIPSSGPSPSRARTVQEPRSPLQPLPQLPLLLQHLQLQPLNPILQRLPLLPHDARLQPLVRAQLPPARPSRLPTARGGRGVAPQAPLLQLRARAERLDAALLALEVG